MPAYDLSLQDFLQYASKQKDFEFPLAERIQMLKRICDGLIYMNKEKKVAHRDIKPRWLSSKLLTHLIIDLIIYLSNILLNVYLDEKNKMKWKHGVEYPKSIVITDFGISSFFRVGEYKRAVGTAGWAPPEQFLDRFSKRFFNLNWN